VIDGAYQVARLYILVVGLLVAVIGSCQIRRWLSFPPENQFAWLALGLFNVAAVVAAAELFGRSEPAGARTYLTAVAVTFALFAVLHHPLRVLLHRRRTRRLVRHYEKDPP
jgi:hypothetical protein